MLLPVLDSEKHYWVGQDELDKLLARGEGWLATHPEREQIVIRYLKFQRRLVREALARLVSDEDPDPDESEEIRSGEEESLERKLSLNDLRVGAVIAALKAVEAHFERDAFWPRCWCREVVGETPALKARAGR